MKKAPKWIVITVLVIALFIILIIDTIIKEANGFGIPAFLKWILILGIGSAIVKCCRR